MRIGYYVQGAMDEAFVRGLARRWCPHAELAEGVFRGSSRESFRREIRKALLSLRDFRGCDILVILTDSDDPDVNGWREVRKRECAKVPPECQHMCVFGVAQRNIEYWLATDRQQLASELGCAPEDIPEDDPSSFVKRRFGMGERDEARREAKERVQGFVARVQMKSWINGSDSFGAFYEDAKRLSKQRNCNLPNEREVV